MNVQELLTKWGFHVDHKPLEKLEHHIEKIKERLEFLSAAEVVKGIFELAEKFSHFAENLGTAATSAGLTVEELQRLQYAAGQAGVGAEEVSGSMARLTRTLYEARNGSASAKEAFAKAGITDEQIAGFHTGADAMGALADRMKGMTDPIAKQALAMQLLGRGSHNMVEFLSDGSEAIKKLGDEADQVGAVVSTKDIKALREMEDAMSSLGQVIRAISAHFAAMFAPAIRLAIKELQQFYAANKELIETRLHDWAMNTIYALGFVTGVVKTLAKVFFDFARGHQELFATLGKFALGYTVINGMSELAKKFGGAISLIGKGVDFGSTVISKLAQALTSIVTNGAKLVSDSLPALRAGFGALSSFLGLGPLGTTLALVAAITALVLAGEAAYTMLFKGGQFKDTWLGQLYYGVKGQAKNLLDNLGLHWLDEEPKKELTEAEKQSQKLNSPWDPETGKPWTREQIAKLAKDAPTYAKAMSDAEAMSKLNAPAEPSGFGSANDPSSRMTAIPTASQTFNITVPVAPKADEDPKAYGRRVGEAVVSGIQGQLDLRSTHAAVTTPERY